jgi:homoserine dehydrogenase
MSNIVNVGVIGLGTVGSSVVKILKRNRKEILAKTGLDVRVKKACDLRDKRSVAGSAYTKNVNDVLNDPEIEIVVETMGGVTPAKQFILKAIANGKSVVTSNKEVIAKHGREIISAADNAGVQVLFEASVCGGIPIIHALRNSLSANNIKEICGIVNGTTNYILSKMSGEKFTFEEALKQAQEKGYAEADPTNDVEGYDAMYKSAILAHVVTGGFVDLKDIYREGITKISPIDIAYAKNIGYVIKLLAVIRNDGKELEVRVHPTLIEKDHPLAKVSDNYNAVFVKGDAVGDLMFYGQGAGGDPTASAVISDILEVACTGSSCEGDDCCGDDCCGHDHALAPMLKLKSMDNVKSRYYIRLETYDKPGVMASIASVFSKKKVSIREVVQHGSDGSVAEIVIILHANREKDIQAALKAIAKLNDVKKISNVIRVGID